MEYTKQNFKSGQILTAEALNNMDSSLESAVNELNNKQEKITDGSIPLSALADDVKDKLNNIFIVPEDFIEEDYGKPDENGYAAKVKQVYITDILENKYNKFYSGTVGDIIITDDFITLIQKYDDYSDETIREVCYGIDIRISDGKTLYSGYVNTSPFVIDVFPTDTATNINAGIRYNFVKSVTDEEITIPEENKQLFKKNMGSFADWNAQEGEAGYIENKPFGKIFKEVEWHLEKYGSYYYCAEVSNQIKIDGIVYDISEDVIDINGSGFMVAEDGIRVYGADEDYLKSVLVKIEAKMDAKYLPDTVVKTTPQTLTDSDKNQALANLGIDPIVWKYICKPFIVKQGSKFPDELLGEGVELDSKYLIPAMYRIFIEDETKVNSNASKGSTITPTCVNYRTMEGPAYSSSGEFVEASWDIDGSIDIHYSV